MYEAPKKYLRWLSVYDPEVHAEVSRGLRAAKRSGKLGELGFIDLLVGVASAAVSAINQKKAEKKAKALAKKEETAAKLQEAKDNLARAALIRSNAMRAAQGLAPVDASGREVNLGNPYLPYIAGGGALLALLLLRARK